MNFKVQDVQLFSQGHKKLIEKPEKEAMSCFLTFQLILDILHIS